ncbi:MAG: PIN domain-containing protein [Candidatus Peregrinibacteria bacterium]
MSKTEFLAVQGKRVLLDTNVIMKIEDSPKTVRGALVTFAKNNDVCICDTVLYELLRNLNAKRFRERHSLIRDAGLQCISEGTPEVRAMFERVNWLYLSALRKEPCAFLHRRQNGLWIIAAGLANGISHFLTTDQSLDFLPMFFSTSKFSLDGNQQQICLHAFNNSSAADEWSRLLMDECCTISLRKRYMQTIKQQSFSVRQKR